MPDENPSPNRKPIIDIRIDDHRLEIDEDDFRVDGIRSKTLGWLLVGGAGAALVAGYVLHAIVNGGN